MVLTCDAAHHDLIFRDRLTMTGPDYIALRREASQRGWRRTGNTWRGACCPKTAGEEKDPAD